MRLVSLGLASVGVALAATESASRTSSSICFSSFNGGFIRIVVPAPEFRFIGFDISLLPKESTSGRVVNKRRRHVDAHVWGLWAFCFAVNHSIFYFLLFRERNPTLASHCPRVLDSPCYVLTFS